MLEQKLVAPIESVVLGILGSECKKDGSTIGIVGLIAVLSGGRHKDTEAGNVK